jgi:hypothetical protein
LKSVDVDPKVFIDSLEYPGKSRPHRNGIVLTKGTIDRHRGTGKPDLAASRRGVTN